MSDAQDTYVMHALTRADAVRMIRKAPKGTDFALHAYFDLPVDGETKVFASTGYTYVDVSRKEAARIAGAMFSDSMEERGARVPISVHTTVIGAYSKTVYWLG